MTMEENKPRRSGNNTTISDATLKQEANGGSSDPETRGRRKHEHIRTSDEEIKEFNKGYYQKAQSQYMDPCREQTKASIKCMSDNNYEKKRCTRFFKDYSDCKKKWMETLREDRRKKNLGIYEEDEPSEIKKEVFDAPKSSP